MSSVASLEMQKLTFGFRKRDQTWNAMSRDEKEQYLRTTKDQGNKRLDFRFAH